MNRRDKDLNARECTTTYNHMIDSSVVYLSARDGSNTSGSFHTTLGRDQCFSASGLAGDPDHQAACCPDPTPDKHRPSPTSGGDPFGQPLAAPDTRVRVPPTQPRPR